MKGLPVVASAVGGVPELINSDTGWPIESTDGIEAYVAALCETIENPQLGVKKAFNLQQLAKSRHCQKNFDADLQRVLSQEKRHD
jgi:glycosyltransferase involved in cell wall biosynthesis